MPIARDPARIPKVLQAIEEVWLRHPNMRLMQLLFDATDVYLEDYEDEYYLEDDELLMAIQGVFGGQKAQQMELFTSQSPS